MALSETCLLDKDNYMFFWKGLPNGSTLLPHLTELPHGISERLMTLKYQLSDKSEVHVISAYAPTLDADQQTKKSPWDSNLETVRISSILKWSVSIKLLSCFKLSINRFVSSYKLAFLRGTSLDGPNI